MSTQNQAECKQATLKQASARDRTSVTVCRTFSSTTESFLLLLLLLPHQNVSEMQRKQVGSLTLGALTLSLSLSPHAATPGPWPQETLRLSLHPRLPLSSAASSYLVGGLDQSKLSVPATIRQAGARCLPLLEPSGRVASSLLSGSLSQCAVW